MNWGNYTKEDFISSDGSGLGAYTVFDAVPGSWNILTLTCSVLDDPKTCYNELVGTYLTPTAALSTSVGLALQFHDVEKVSFGHLANKLTPMEFVRLLRVFNQKLIPVMFFGLTWLDYVEQRAELLTVLAPPASASIPNVTKVDFKSKTIIH
jgi:hypothetical protein